jgi:C4-type Zn-finger protein
LLITEQPILCLQEQGVKFRVLIQTERDLSRQVVKSDFATVAVPEIELEIPYNSQKGGEVVGSFFKLKFF